MKEKDWSYIRAAGNVHEDLFDLRTDPKEEHNLAGQPSAQTTLERLQRALDRLTAGPLVPERFNP